MRELSRQVGLLVLVIVILAALLIIFSALPGSPATPSGTPTGSLPPQTVPSAAQLEQLKTEPAFQYLVSYTDKGFQPSTLTVKEGQTVRFTNNSSHQLWVASVGVGSVQIYPGTSSCGGSAFDSCSAMAPGDHWEFTFNQRGTWEFQNNADPSDTGDITVE